MGWRRPYVKPLSEPMIVRLLTHICLTRAKWVKKNPISHFYGHIISSLLLSFLGRWNIFLRDSTARNLSAAINILRLRQYGRHFDEDISKSILFHENYYILMKKFHRNLFPGVQLITILHWPGNGLVCLAIFIPPLQRSWKGGILVSPCPSVRLSVCGQNRVRSVSSTILIRSISYLHILSSNFRRCLTCNICFKMQKLEILANSLNL